MEEILYREDPSHQFEKYIYIGTAYPENMYTSHPHFKSLEDWQHLIKSDDYSEILVNLLFCQYIFKNERESFEDYFGKEFYKIFKRNDAELGVAEWFMGLDEPVFSGLDLRDKEIEESTYFDNGEHKQIIFTDGSEVQVLNDKNGYCEGYYLSEEEYPHLLEDIEGIRNIIKSMR